MVISSEEIKSLSSLLKKHSFIVPDYQRGYEWESENVNEFHKMLRLIQDTKEEVFLGTLIIKRETDRAISVELVDGQQRITTIFLYLSILRDLLSELSVQQFPAKGLDPIGRNPSSIVNDLLLNDDKNDYRLKPNELIQTLFIDYVAAAPKSTDGVVRKKMPKKHKSYTKDFRRAYSLIRELLEEDLEKAVDGEHNEFQKLVILDGFLDAISEKLLILPIFTNNDAEALEIFMTMNTKGLRLAASDIIKSNILKGYLSGASESARPEISAVFLKKWTTLLDNLEDGNVDQALRHHFLARQKDSFQVRELIPITTARLEEKPFGMEHNASKLLEELVEMSANYKQILDAKIEYPSDEGAEINKAIRSIDESLFILNKVNSSSRILSLQILFPLMKFSVLECAELVSTIERLTMSWQMAGQNAQTLEDHFQSLAYQMNANHVGFDYLMSQLNALFPDEEKVRAELMEPINDSTLSRVILFRIHQYLGDPDRSLPYDTKKTDVEHIAPQAQTPEWLGALGLTDSEEDKTAYEALVELIGNKVLLEESINNGLRQRPFAEKKNGFEMVVKKKTQKYLGLSRSFVQSTRQVTLNSDWGSLEIERRTEWLVDCFVKIFACPSRVEDLIQYEDFISRTTP